MIKSGAGCMWQEPLSCFSDSSGGGICSFLHWLMVIKLVINHNVPGRF